ncbi:MULTISPECIES: DUF7144 family membrane protein [Nocardia]|jgi:hypothetical protein|uniref:DUF7144 family membrane protein n=1 Tax=Nocardia TaxID=1817 RepID=UPI001893B6DD|nr:MULTISPECIES: hypothetical protein [Nocardia]MBF6218507.1 hypothetical protein [Nocardia abscessus]MBF6471043.1 hypothetical protein [Nocardia abscessus]MDE1670051.1 hypothetical protein [Nocardia gipuzkoensis]
MTSPITTRPVLGDMTIFAGVLILVAGVLHLLTAVAAISGREVFVVTEDQVFLVDVAAWGWIHLTIGVLVVIAGLGIVVGKPWAFLAGLVLAAISILDNFLFVSIYPFWALVLIAVDVLVIWALARQLAAA